MAEGGGLVVHSTIQVETPDGQREIQLLFGDITKLPVEEKVDVLMVSAFAGDYAATRTSVIGALKYSLNISVRDLARDKKEDLRQHFHCWQSHPLPDHLPYGEIVCFETPVMRGFRHPAELVGDVFRCLIPMFQNQEKSVITPLLATGDQHYSRTVMLQAMLDAAINWVRAGLPMKCLKIVLYNRNPSHLSSEEKKLVDLFTKNKAQVEKQQEASQARKEAKYDVYLSYHTTDNDKVTEISKLMLKEHSKLRIFSEEQHFKENVAFQDDILDTMKQSRRVVTVLSPAFLSSAECVEKYNLALCVNRRSKKNILAPFYIETITDMPTYMTLVQYVDVRERDGTKQRLITGVQTFVVTIKLVSRHSVLRPMNVQYDVFISYSHRNSDQAKYLLDILRRLNPELSIFFDRNELKTGFSWQQTLYHAIDNSTVLVALLSPDYLSSQVCLEEYSLALCRHLTQSESSDGLELVPVMIEKYDTLPPQLAEVPVMDATQDFNASALEIARALISFNQGKEKNMNVFREVKTPFNLNSILTTTRKQTFHENFVVQENNICHKRLDYKHLQKTADDFRKTDAYKNKMDEIEAIAVAAKLAKEEEQRNLTAIVSTKSPGEGEELVDYVPKKNVYDLEKVYDVAFVCADYLEGTFLNSLLLQRAPHLSSNFYVDSEDAEMAALEKARLCVVFLSPRMVTVTKDVEEFNVALARHRKSSQDQQRVFYPIIVGQLPRHPTYCHLVPCDVTTSDPLWIDVMADSQMTSAEKCPPGVAEADGELRKSFQEGLSVPAMLALSAACDDIISILSQKGSTAGTDKNIVINNIVALNLQQKCQENKKSQVSHTDSASTQEKPKPQHLSNGEQETTEKKMESQRLSDGVGPKSQEEKSETKHVSVGDEAPTQNNTESQQVSSKDKEPIELEEQQIISHQLLEGSNQSQTCCLM